MMAQVPLTGHSRGKALPFQELGEGDLAVSDPNLGAGPESAMNADPVGITAGEQGRPRCRTDRLGHVKIGKPATFTSQSVKVRRLESLAPKQPTSPYP